MAVQFASVQTQNNLGADVSQITITKPVSLAVGDLMVAHIIYQRSATLTPLTGWNNLAGTVDSADTLDEGAGGNYKSSIQWKLADSGDVAATNFTWVVTVDTTVRMAGAIYRIIGHTSTPIGASNGVVTLNSATPSHSNGITPTTADSLLMMLGSTSDGTAGSGYAIAVSDPTWTERVDVSGAIIGATATRTQTTGTGNSTFTIAGGSGSTDSTCYLIAINPEPDPTLTPSAITVTVNVPAPSMTVPYSASPSAISVTVSIPTPTLTSTDNPWSNTSKNSSTWSNQAKS